MSDLDDRDLILLRDLSGAGNFLKPNELADSLEMEPADVDARLTRLLAAGYVKCYFIATVQGSAQVVRHVHHHRALNGA